MSEDFINSFGKGLYYLNEIKPNKDGNLVCFRVVGKIKVNRIVSSNTITAFQIDIFLLLLIN